MQISTEELRNEFADRVVSDQLTSSLRNKEWLENKITEYENLKPQLLQLGCKSEHKVMVPICGVAYFPNGRIKHSNEFLVALGDNYFIQRTSQECQPIIDRRIEKLQEQVTVIDKHLARQSGVSEVMQKQKEGSKDKNWFDIQGNPTTDDTITHWDEDGCLDIREEYDPQKDDTSGQETEPEVLKEDQVRTEGIPIAKSPADLRKLMEKVQKEEDER